ncbi:MAG TPA: DUF2721 domain-containing protein [Fimbriiglobus sp.]|jgi:hypothetical protein
MPIPDPSFAPAVLGAMITPAVLISASGTLVLSTSNRLGRVVDRVRTLSELAETFPTDSHLTDEDRTEKRALIVDQLAHLTKRIRILQSALRVLYASIGLLISSSIAIGIDAATVSRLGWLPVGLGLVGASGLFFGSMLLVREARLAVDSTLHELGYVGRLVARKTAPPEAR